MNLKLNIFILFFILCNISNGEDFVYLKDGGYKAKVCLNFTDKEIEFSNQSTSYVIKCNRETLQCYSGTSYSCNLPCGFVIKPLKINKKVLKFTEIRKIEFEIPKRQFDSIHEPFVINLLTNISVFLSDIRIILYNPKGYCYKIKISNRSISCYWRLVKNSLIQKRFNISVNISFGNESCIRTQHLGFISVNNNMLYYLLVIPFCAIFFIAFIVGFVCINQHKKKKIQKISVQHNKLINEKETQYINLNKRAFLEYQTSVDSFDNLGILTHRHLVTFKDFASRILNIELTKKVDDEKLDEIETFKSFLLNKCKLIEWITLLENQGEIRSRERNLLASHLTVVLFHHPKYFLNIMKELLTKVIIQMKNNSGEKLLFRRSEGIIEKLIGNWLCLCMYKNMKDGDIGKRFFYLCRAIKCKLEAGVIDVYSQKSKYGLSYDNMLVGELEYEPLTIKVDILILLKTKDPTNILLEINIEELGVQVLSLDSISQVKRKILDKAVMNFAISENFNTWDETIDMSLDLPDINEFVLQYVTNSSKLILDDFDQTNLYSEIQNEYVIVNTMKHYNIKNGTRMLLTLKANLDKEYIPCNMYEDQTFIHLQYPKYNKEQMTSNTSLKDYGKGPKNRKPIFKPIEEEMNKELYLMFILATKKSLVPFIDGFFQSLMNLKSCDIIRTSSNSLFDVDLELSATNKSISNCFNNNSQTITSNESYLIPTYYLFSMFDNIANSLSITDKETLKIWKNNSFILRLWVNLIKNPSFIFMFERTEYIDNCLTTIASVLMESCSSRVCGVDINSPIVKQLFLEDVNKKYSQWWNIFINNAQDIPENYMISLMRDVVQNNQMENYYENSIKELIEIANQFLIPVNPEIMTRFD